MQLKGFAFLLAAAACHTLYAAESPIAAVMDSNGNSTISDAEALEAVRQTRVICGSQHELRAVIRPLCDLDGDDGVSLEEAQDFVGKQRIVFDKQAAVADEFLAEVDTDKNQTITVTELNEFRKKQGDLGNAAGALTAQFSKVVDLNRNRVLEQTELRLKADAVRSYQLIFSRTGLTGEQVGRWLRTVGFVVRLDENANGGIDATEASRGKVLSELFPRINRSRNETIDPGELYDFIEHQLAYAKAEQAKT